MGKYKGTHKQYKGKYFLIFYDETDMWPLYVFDNIREILTFMGRPITKQNINLINVELYRAFKRNNNITRFLTGEVMKVYIIDCDEEKE